MIKLGLVVIIMLIAVANICDTIRELLLKSAINSLDISIHSVKKAIIMILRLALIPRVWLGFIFSCLSLFIWLFVLSKADLNFAFSLDSMHYVFVAVAAAIILKEKVEAKRWIGTLLIMIGIIIVSISGGG